MKLLTDKTALLFVFLFALIPLGGLMHAGLPITHDGIDHVARIANFYDALTEGILIPRWAWHLNWGYGHPILMFLYPFPSYLSSLFHSLHFSYIDSLKLTFFVTFIASGIAMYILSRSLFGIVAGLVSAVAYMFAPYRFVDLYVRGAIGEHVGFVFIPLIAYFLYALSKRFSKWNIFGGALSVCGLLLSHNAVSIMALPFFAVYALLLLYQSKSKKNLLIQYIFIFIIGFALSSFFLMPAFFEGKYTLRDIVTKGGYEKSFVTLQSLFYGEWNYGGSGLFTVQIGIVQLISIVFSLLITIYIFFKKKKKEYIGFVTLVFLFLFASIFIMLPLSNPIWQKITTLQKFQFPWRFLTVVVFYTAILIGFCIYNIKNKKLQLLVSMVALLLLFFFNKDYIHAKNYLYHDDKFFEKIYHGTTDTGESAPIWSIRFMEKEPLDSMQIVEGEGTFQQIKRTTTRHEYLVTVNSDTAQILENTLYFPGWNVYGNGKKISDIEFQNPKYRGLMTYYLNKGKNKVIIVFEDTKLRTIAHIISFLGLLMLLCIMIMPKKLFRFLHEI